MTQNELVEIARGLYADAFGSAAGVVCGSMVDEFQVITATVYTAVRRVQIRYSLRPGMGAGRCCADIYWTARVYAGRGPSAAAAARVALNRYRVGQGLREGKPCES